MAEEVEMTPITPDEGAVPPKVTPSDGNVATKPTLKLKPIIRKPAIHKPVIGGAKPMMMPPGAVPAPSAAAALENSTQNLKSVTGPIPAPATLKKTGIVAEGIITPAQQQAAKSKTSRISLESAIGVAPAKETPSPMKTIRLRRPTDLKPPAAAPAPAPSPVMTPVTDDVQATAAPPDTTTSAPDMTQKKTLKLHRPASANKPVINFSTPTENAGSDVVDMDPVNIPDAANKKPAIPTWVSAMSLVISIAALIVVGFVMYYLWTEGAGPVVGENEMQFIQVS